MKILIAPAGRGGIRSVVEAYERDGFLKSQDVTVIKTYVDGGFVKRQIVFIQAFLQFLLYCVTRRPQLVHIHAAMWGSFWRKSLLASMARLFGTPVILHLHGSEMKLFYERQRPFARGLIRRQLEKANRVIVLSESWRTFIHSVAPQARITIVPNYVVVPPLPAPERRDPQQILFLGKVGTRKGAFDLIEAMVDVTAKHPEARLVLGGDGEVDKARALVGELGLTNNIDVAGWTAGDAKQALIDGSRIYVLPSYNEGLPMSVLEAMAAGLAVVTTTVGGIPELLTDGKDGLLIEPGDRKALAAALSSLLSDPDLLQRLADAGRARIEQSYSMQAILPSLARIYDECKR